MSRATLIQDTRVNPDRVKWSRAHRPVYYNINSGRLDAIRDVINHLIFVTKIDPRKALPSEIEYALKVSKNEGAVHWRNMATASQWKLWDRDWWEYQHQPSDVALLIDSRRNKVNFQVFKMLQKFACIMRAKPPKGKPTESLYSREARIDNWEQRVNDDRQNLAMDIAAALGFTEEEVEATCCSTTEIVEYMAEIY